MMPLPTALARLLSSSFQNGDVQPDAQMGSDIDSMMQSGINEDQLQEYLDRKRRMQQGEAQTPTDMSMYNTLLGQ